MEYFSKASLLFLLHLLSSTYIWTSLQACDFYVGGRDGWVPNPSSQSFQHWADTNTFKLHDKLVFKYKKGEDAVLEVNNMDYLACNASNPIVRMGSGDSWFKFRTTGSFFFISGILEHCKKGQKMVAVVVREECSTPSTSSPSIAPHCPPAFLFPPPPPAPISTNVPAPAPAPSGSSHLVVSPAIVLWVMGVILGGSFL